MTQAREYTPERLAKNIGQANGQLKRYVHRALKGSDDPELAYKIAKLERRIERLKLYDKTE